MGKKAADALCKIAYVILAVCPFAIAIFYAVRYMSGHLVLERLPDFYDLPELRHYLLAGFLLVLIALLIGGIQAAMKAFAKKIGWDGHRRMFLYAAAAFLITIGLRLLLLRVFVNDIVPFSDYLYSWQFAHGDMEHLYRQIYFCTWVNYGYFLQLLIGILPDTYATVLYFGAVINALSAVMIVLLMREIGMRAETSLLGGLLYAFYPSGIIHVTCGNPEHIGVLMFLMCIYFLCRFLHAESTRGRLLYALAAAVACGVGNIFKPLSTIVFVAFAIVLFLDILGDRGKRKLSYLLVCLAAMCILYVGQTLITDAFTDRAGDEYGVKMSYTDTIPHFLMVGLVPDGEGQTGRGAMSDYYTQMRQAGQDYETAKGSAMEELAKEWKQESLSYIPLFISKKLTWAWQDDLRPVSFLTKYSSVTEDSAANTLVLSFINDIGYTMSELAYVAIMILGLIGVISLFLQKKTSDLAIFLPNLMIVGFFCLLMISESQSQYKYNIMGFVFVIAAIGLGYIVDRAAEKMADRKDRGTKICQTH